jgi:hypothetical protein
MFGCSESGPEKGEIANTDLATLEEFIPLSPKPVAAQWSVLEEKPGLALGPADSAFFALLSYAPSDYPIVEKSLTEGDASGGGFMRKAPKWLPHTVTQSAMNAVGEGFDFGTRAVSAKPFFLSPFTDGFAVTYPSERKVLVYLITQ